MISDLRFKNRKLKIKNQKSQKGVAALMTVIIIGAATLIMAFTAAVLGLGEIDMGYTAGKSGEALAIADGCMEEVLRHIRLDTNYGVGSGQISLSVLGGSCLIKVTDLGASQRRINVTGTSGDYRKKLESRITLSGDVISVNSWEEK